MSDATVAMIKTFPVVGYVQGTSQLYPIHTHPDAEGTYCCECKGFEHRNTCRHLVMFHAGDYVIRRHFTVKFTKPGAIEEFSDTEKLYPGDEVKLTLEVKRFFVPGTDEEWVREMRDFTVFVELNFGYGVIIEHITETPSPDAITI